MYHIDIVIIHGAEPKPTQLLMRAIVQELMNKTQEQRKHQAVARTQAMKKPNLALKIEKPIQVMARVWITGEHQ